MKHLDDLIGRIAPGSGKPMGFFGWGTSEIAPREEGEDQEKGEKEPTEAGKTFRPP